MKKDTSEQEQSEQQPDKDSSEENNQAHTPEKPYFKLNNFYENVQLPQRFLYISNT